MKTQSHKILFSCILLTFELFAIRASAQVPPDREELLKGEGSGQGMFAESNGYPGPKHVLDLGDGLKLTMAQRTSIQEIYDEMKSRAQELGRRIVGIEDELNEAFKSGLISETSVRDDCEQIGKLRGRLRAVHLAAHLKTDKVLTEEQHAQYKKLRGAEKGMKHAGQKQSD